MLISYFNCTIQELKLKTSHYNRLKWYEFQLHHTGIKTHEHNMLFSLFRYFNCTIQELKLCYLFNGYLR